MTRSGRLLGVDYGRVRVGLAICDSEQMIASPLAVYRRRSPTQDADFFRQLIAREEVSGIVVGLPIHTDSNVGRIAEEARDYGNWLARITGLPVDYWDERCSTLTAEEFLREAGVPFERRRERVDKVAAQIILQSYLDARRS